MLKCENYTENCFNKNCNVINKITIQDIDNFFNPSNSLKCNTKIIYINRHETPSVLSELYVKQVDQDCHIFYTIKNNYYYVYPQFITNILLWSSHLRAFGIEGRLGNHISIGLNNTGDIDIHETIYTTTFSNHGHILIANKIHFNYKIASDNKRLISNNAHMHQLAQIIWDDICCSVYNPVVIGGSLPDSQLNNKKIHNIIVKDSSKKQRININNLVNLINKLLIELPKYKNKNHIVELPYIRPSQLKLIAKKIEKDNKNEDEILIITNTNSKSSALFI